MGYLRSLPPPQTSPVGPSRVPVTLALNGGGGLEKGLARPPPPRANLLPSTEGPLQVTGRAQQTEPHVPHSAVNKGLQAFLDDPPAWLGTCPAAEDFAVHEAAVRRTGHWAILGFAVFVLLVLLGLVAYECASSGQGEVLSGGLMPNYQLLLSQHERASLLFHPKLPWYVRYGLPGLVCGCLMLNVFANTHRAGTVFPVLRAGAQTLRLPDVKAFDIGTCVHEMWQAGVWRLALMIAYAGGLWGYLKCFGLLLCWTVPRRFLSAKSCEGLLILMDFVGKFSLANQWVMMLLQTANRFHLEVWMPCTLPLCPGVSRERGEGGAIRLLQPAHHATFSTAPTHQLLGSANAETTPAGAPAAAADRTQRPDATCEGKNG